MWLKNLLKRRLLQVLVVISVCLIFAVIALLKNSDSSIVEYSTGTLDDSLKNDVTPSPYTTYSTEMSTRFIFGGDKYETFLPWDEIIIDLRLLFLPDNVPNRNFKLRIYDLHTAENFINYHGERTFIEELSIEAIEAIDFTDPWELKHYLFLEKTLPEGYYLFEIHSEDKEAPYTQKFIQISAISVYSVTIYDKTIFWVHDTYTGEAAVGAVVTANGTTATTDNEGLAFLELEDNAEITIQYKNYLPYIYTKEVNPEDNTEKRFFFYMYIDRTFYTSDDIVNVFGVLKPMSGHSFAPTDVFSLRINYDEIIPITLNEFGSFTVSVPAKGEYSMMFDLFANDERLKVMFIENFDKLHIADEPIEVCYDDIFDEWWLSIEHESESTMRYFDFTTEKTDLRLGETTLVSLLETDMGDNYRYGIYLDEPQVTEGQMLLITLSNSIMSTTVGSPQGIPITFTEDMIPNLSAVGAYFDGRHIYPIMDQTLFYYDFTEREFNIDLDFCNENYAPHDEVTVNINTAPHAQVLISAIDDAAINPNRNNIDFIRQFYYSGFFWGSRLDKYLSHRQHELGKPRLYDEIISRRNSAIRFSCRHIHYNITPLNEKINSVFETVLTDENGKASLAFTLPDYETALRVTAIAVTLDGYGGDTHKIIE